MDRESLRRWLEKDIGIRPTEKDLAVLVDELTTLGSTLERWRRLDLRDSEPAFLVHESLPGKGR